MPGVNCAVFGCGPCRRTKGIGIFKLPSAKDEKHKRRREEWLGELKKTRYNTRFVGQCNNFGSNVNFNQPLTKKYLSTYGSFLYHNP